MFLRRYVECSAMFFRSFPLHSSNVWNRLQPLWARHPHSPVFFLLLQCASDTCNGATALSFIGAYCCVTHAYLTHTHPHLVPAAPQPRREPRSGHVHVGVPSRHRQDVDDRQPHEREPRPGTMITWDVSCVARRASCVVRRVHQQIQGSAEGCPGLCRSRTGKTPIF